MLKIGEGGASERELQTEYKYLPSPRTYCFETKTRHSGHRGKRMKLYHQTSRQNLSSILEKGLIPNLIGIVYLTPLLGLGFGEVTLQVETGNNKLTAFEDCSDWEVLCWGRIPSENITFPDILDIGLNWQKV